MITISFLILIGVIWIILKVLTLLIELPFRILGLLFGGTMTAIFWIIFAVLLIGAVL